MTQTVTLTMDGKTQAIRLPVEFRFDCQEVYIEKQGDAVILRLKPENLATRWRRFFETVEAFPEEFLAQRGDNPPQDRAWFHDVDA